MTVYFAQAPGGSETKIGKVSDRPVPTGHSTRLQCRLSAIAKELGRSVVAVAVTPGGLFVERWFHQRYAATRLQGERFANTPLLLQDIAALAAGERIEGQPDEPHARVLPARLARHYRVNLFRLGQAELAGALGLQIGSLRYGECCGGSILRAINYVAAAEHFSVPLSLAQILRDVSAEHRSRYRAHAVRDCVVSL